MRTIDVVIVNYRTRTLTAVAVESVLTDPCTRQVIVVDNASSDGSVEELAGQFAAAPVEVLALPDNRGFGAACNAGTERATARYVFFLNSDARVEPGALALLQASLESNPRLGIAAPAVFDAGGRRQVDAQGDFPTAWSILLRRTRHPPATRAPDWVSGVAMLVRRDEYRSVGGFDPRFFLYYEDVDLCRRYRARGFGVERIDAARVVHAGGASRPSAHDQRQAYDRSQDLYLACIGTPPPLHRLVTLARRIRRRWPPGDGS